MPAPVDGSVVIQVNVDVSQAEKGLKALEDRIKDAEKTLDQSKDGDSGLSQQIDKAKEKAGELEEVILNLSKMEFAPGYSQDAINFIEDYAKHMQDASTASNEMQTALENARAQVENLEKQGRWFGDEDYDAAVKQLERVTSDIEEYRKSLLSPETPENPFGLDTIAGRVRDAEIALDRLIDAGRGLGDEEYDKAYRNLALLRNEARQYAAELAKTPEQAEREAAALEKAAQRAQEMAAREAQAAAEAARLQEIRENAVVSDQAVVDLNRELADLKKRLSDLDAAGVGMGYEEYDRIAARIREINAELRQVREGSTGTASAMDRMQKSAARFSMRLREVVRSALVFTVISQGLAALREWLGRVITSNEEASAAIARLRGALLTLAQPLINVIIPAFTAFVNILASIISTVANLVSALFGTTAEASAEAAESLYNETDAIESTGKAAEKASKSLASFDQINQLSSGGVAGASGGGGGGGGIEPNFDTSFISQGLDQIVTILGGALLAVGAVLTFSGANIPVGIGLMAAGALVLGGQIVENWGAISTMLQGPIGVLTAILGGSLLVLGAILAFSGAGIPLGIGLMVAGAIGLASSITANWETLSTVLQGPIGVIVGILSGALLVLGALFAFSGANIPLGLGLMMLGASGLATTVTANWETLSTILQGPIGVITGILSTSALVLGSILTFSGANIPLGIGLLIVGAAGLATNIAANWETIQTYLQVPIGVILSMVSTALLVLGAILAFSGASLPLGIGLIAVGSVGLVTAISANWDTLTSLLQGPIATITAIVSAALLVLGVILIFTGAAIPLGLGMLIAGGAGLAATVAPNWDFILDACKEAWNSITRWWDNNVAKFFTLDFWADLGKNIINGLLDGLKSVWSTITNWVSDRVSWITGAFSGARAEVSAEYSTRNTGRSRSAHQLTQEQTVSLASAASYMRNNIPRLAQGAVIPPNREFLAVLGDQRRGTNIEAPVSEIESAVTRGIKASGNYGVREIRIVVSAKNSLVRDLKFELDRETQRQGVSLVNGGTARR